MLVPDRTAGDQPATGPQPLPAHAVVVANPAVDPFGAQVWPKLSHELRSPLAGIIGLTRILLMRLEAGQADAATQVRQLELVQASAARSLATIEQVVDTVVARVLDHLGVPQKLVARWAEEKD